MPVFKFAITAPATQTANVEVEAATIEEAHAIALSHEFYTDPEKAKFEFDEGNTIDDVYLPDEDDYEIAEDETATPTP